MDEKLELHRMAGEHMALTAAVMALIASHPKPEAFATQLDQFDLVMQEVLLSREALQGDAGMRAAFGGMRRLLLGAIPES